MKNQRRVVVSLMLALVVFLPQFASAHSRIPSVATTPVTREAAATTSCAPRTDLRSTLSAGGRTATVTNTSTTCSYTVVLASYRMFDKVLANQVLFDWSTVQIAPGTTATLQVELPDCKAQVDLYAGPVVFTFPAAPPLPGRFLKGLWTSGAFCAPPINCTLTQGYWKNHPEAWPLATLQLGTVTYSKDQLLAILNTPVQGNGLIALAHQLIAAKLNLASGVKATDIGVIIASADALIGSRVVGQHTLPTSSTSSLVEALDNFNMGVTGPGHCDD